ncbi:MAG TPA: hypothetical protein VF458_22245 [Ktedonobacteraceae bacterium]
MATQRWRAKWRDEMGREREFLFDSLNNRMVARIDFQLKCLHVASGAIHVPEVFEMEEVAYGQGNDSASSYFHPQQLVDLSRKYQKTEARPFFVYIL